MPSEQQQHPATRPFSGSTVLIGMLALLLLLAGGYGVYHYLHRPPVTPKPVKIPLHNERGPLVNVFPNKVHPVLVAPPPNHPTVTPPKTNKTKPPIVVVGKVDPELFSAAYTGNITKLRSILANHPTFINAKDPEQGAPPLLWAIVKAKPEVIKFLLSKGADVEARGKNGSTPLQRAAFDGRTDMVKLLLEHGADINATDSSKGTALLKAVGRGHAQTALYLLKCNAQVNTREDDNGMTPLHLAVLKKEPQVVAQLLAHGANVAVRTKTDKATPLEYATMLKQRAIMAMLRKAGAKQ